MLYLLTIAAHAQNKHLHAMPIILITVTLLVHHPYALHVGMYALCDTVHVHTYSTYACMHSASVTVSVCRRRRVQLGVGGVPLQEKIGILHLELVFPC